MFIFVKTATGFVTNNLAGDWFLCGSDIQGDHTWDGTLVIANDGTVTGGSINSSDGPTYSIVGGSMSIDNAGSVTGTIQDSDGITTQLTMHMDPAKGLIAGEGNASGEDGVFALVRHFRNISVSIALDQPAQRVELSITNLYPGSIYTIQRSFTIQTNAWLNLESFEALDTETNWTETISSDWNKAFWRIK